MAHYVYTSVRCGPWHYTGMRTVTFPLERVKVKKRSGLSYMLGLLKDSVFRMPIQTVMSLSTREYLHYSSSSNIQISSCETCSHRISLLRILSAIGKIPRPTSGCFAKKSMTCELARCDIKIIAYHMFFFRQDNRVHHDQRKFRYVNCAEHASIKKF